MRSTLDISFFCWSSKFKCTVFLSGLFYCNSTVINPWICDYFTHFSIFKKQYLRCFWTFIMNYQRRDNFQSLCQPNRYAKFCFSHFLTDSNKPVLTKPKGLCALFQDNSSFSWFSEVLMILLKYYFPFFQCLFHLVQRSSTIHDQNLFSQAYI